MIIKYDNIVYNKMKGKSVFYSLIFSTFLFCSFFSGCKNSSEVKITYNESDTIKNKVQNKEQAITWAVEIEPERLTTPIMNNGYKISPEILFTKDIIKLSPHFQKKTFPEFADFGSLDTRKIEPKLKAKLEEFCEKLSENSPDAASFFNNSYVFSYVFFINELPEDLEIKKWIYGQPFLGEEIIQLPVRFFCKSDVFDVTIYINSKSNEFYQITIDRWEKV